MGKRPNKTAITPVLTLLFDGLTEAQIVEKLIEAVGPVKAQCLAFTLAHSAGVNIMLSICPADILEYLAELADDRLGPENDTFLGTEQQLIDACLSADARISDDTYADVRDSLIDQLTDQGLIGPTPDTQKVT